MSHTRVGHVVGGRYRLESVLGEGGMAVVWRAVHTETDRRVALKLVRPNLLANEQARDLFVREARIAARIGRSEHIVDVLDAGVDAELEVPFIVMELLEGEPLDVRLKRDGAVVGELAADLVEQLGDALDQAHASGVVHRDLKPQNLFLSKDRKGKTTLKVLDFGIAKLAETAQESATQIGTPAYSAPEQLGASWRAIAAQQGNVIAATVGPATDVWAFGLVVYEMLTGAASGELWGATTLAELPVKIVLEPTPLASQRAGARGRGLPPGFDAWLARCLALDASRRWPRAGEAALAVASVLRGAATTTPNVGAMPQAASMSQVPSMPRSPSGAPVRAPSYPDVPHYASAPPAPMHPGMVTTAAPFSAPYPLDPRLAAWAHDRRVELRPASLAHLKALEPWTFLSTVGRAGLEVRAPVDDAIAHVVEAFGGDVVSQAMGEERMVLGLLTTPRARGRVAVRSKMSSGLADDIGRGLKLLDGLVGVASTSKTIGDRLFEAHFDVSSPSPQEGHAVLTMPLRQLLVNGGFRGALELRAGLVAVVVQGVRTFEPGSIEALLGLLTNVHRALA